MGYINSSNFWWILCLLICLHYYFYFSKIFISLSIYELTIITYLLDNLKYQNTFFNIFLCLKQNWRATKGVLPAFSANLCVPDCIAMAILSCDPAVIFQYLNVCMQSPQMNWENFLAVPGRGMRDNSHKTNEAASRWKRKEMEKPKQNWKNTQTLWG